MRRLSGVLAIATLIGVTAGCSLTIDLDDVAELLDTDETDQDSDDSDDSDGSEDPPDTDGPQDFDNDGYYAGDGPGDDCDDLSAGVNPGHLENDPFVCLDGRDNDCNGFFDQMEPECEGIFDDFDGDDSWAFWDCDDTEPLMSPYLDEVCGDGLDNDCNGLAYLGKR